MAKQKLEYTISAKDQSASVLRKVLGELGGFSGQASRLVTAPFRALTSLRGLGLQANIQLVRGLGIEVGNLVERSSRLEVVRKSFESLTGRTGNAADRLARQLREAANGTVSMTRAMEIANRALAAGLTSGDLATALDFISKKAITTGKDAGQAIDTVITGLARGSVLFLDDFGVLVDGVDSVKRDFDRIRGAGAFDQLGPAAQKAEIVRAAIADMRRQMGAIGVSGREAVFSFARIKNEVTNAIDRLFAAVGQSKVFQSALRDLASIVDGISTAIGGPDQGRAFASLAKHAKALLGAVFIDLGRLLAQGLVEAVRHFLPVMLDGLKEAARFFGEVLLDAGKRLVALLTIELNKLPFLKGMFNVDAAKGILAAPGPVPRGLEALKSLMGFGHAPFAATGQALGEAGRAFRGGRFGRDVIEIAEDDAGRRVLPAERARQRFAREQARRERADLETRLDDPGLWKRPGARMMAFMRAAQGEFDRGELGGEDRGKLTFIERRQLLRTRARELAAARINQLSTTERDIGIRLNGGEEPDEAAPHTPDRAGPGLQDAAFRDEMLRIIPAWERVMGVAAPQQLGIQQELGLVAAAAAQAGSQPPSPLAGVVRGGKQALSWGIDWAPFSGSPPPGGRMGGAQGMWGPALVDVMFRMVNPFPAEGAAREMLRGDDEYPRGRGVDASGRSGIGNAAVDLSESGLAIADAAKRLKAGSRELATVVGTI